MTTKSIVRSAAAVALMLAFGLPSHAEGGKISLKCPNTPVSCDPTPTKCPTTPPCSAVPEPASVALVAVGAVALLPIAMRAMKTRRQVG